MKFINIGRKKINITLLNENIKEYCMKRLLCLILVCCMSLFFVGCSETKSSDTDSGKESETVVPELPSENNKFSEGLSYSKKSDGTYWVVGIGTCSDADIIIPSVYQNQSVAGIAEDAFAFADNIRSIEIPKSIKSIDKNAFYYCVNLESAIFEEKQGWTAKALDTLITGVELTLDEASQAATLLKDTYSTYYWRKN